MESNSTAFLIKIKLRHSLGRPSRSDFVQAKVVRMIFRLYLDGNGAHRIAKILNTSGITTVTGGRWYESTIRQMLKNEKYKGDCLLQKYYVPKVGGGTVVNKGELQSY